jgi:hypothetical protein
MIAANPWAPIMQVAKLANLDNDTQGVILFALQMQIVSGQYLARNPDVGGKSDSSRSTIIDEIHIEGFRFDLASVFSRNSDGSLNWGDTPIFSEIAADPELGLLKLIAEPWDTGAYQLGREFPELAWLQWNARFRDDVRRFVKGDPGLVPDLMRRIYGSDDLFPDSRPDAYHAYQSARRVAGG